MFHTSTLWIFLFGGMLSTGTVFACYRQNDFKAPTSVTANSTFRVCDKKPERHYFHSRVDSVSPQSEITKLDQYKGNKCTEILQMSNFSSKTYISSNGLVKTVVDAYNNHYNLVLRPDDVWAAIMTQFSFYVNKHSEEFRGKFVNFEGKKELTIAIPGSLRTAPYDMFVKLMTEKIHENLIDPEVKDWVLPKFSTTTDNDLVTVGVVFMATMKNYFVYRAMMLCGIPYITLEGTLQDWKDIYSRLEKLKEYKLAKWYTMLEPIVKQFVDAKQGKVDLDFWQRIAHYERGGSGPDSISGWITVFCAFDKDGNFREPSSRSQWLRIPIHDIPTGIVEVDVKIDDNGAEYNSVMLAGHMGAEIKNGGDTIQPALGWIMALKPNDTNYPRRFEN